MKAPKSTAARSLALILTLGAWSCGTEEQIRPAGTHGGAQGEDAEPVDQGEGETPEEVPFDTMVEPPQEYYDALFADTVERLDDQDAFGLAGTTQVLWVNFDGASLQKGFGRGDSFILCKSAATIPPSGFSPADRQSIVEMVQQHYDEAGAALVVTQDQPQGDFTTIHVGGAYSDLGCLGAGVLGVAPFDQGNANVNDVGFAFTSQVQNLKIVAETISHEAGHSFGLEHITNDKGLMYASSSPNIEGFREGRVRGANRNQNGPEVLKAALGVIGGTAAPATASAAAQSPAPVAVNSPIPGLPNLPGNLAGLPGLDQLAGIGNILPGLDPTALLDISNLLPQVQNLVPGLLGGAGALPGLDKILTIVGGAGVLGGNTGVLPVGGGNGGLPIDLSQAATIIGSLAGGLTGNPASLAGLAGLLLPGITGGSGATPPQPLPSVPSIGSLPDLSSLLGLAGAQGSLDPAELIKNLVGSARVVNGNFQGQDRDALLSLLKVAYSQAYQSSNGN